MLCGARNDDLRLRRARGRPRKLTPLQPREAIERRQRGRALTDIARTYRVAHTTVASL